MAGPFKMKGNPMKRNFGIGSPLHDEGDGNHPMHHKSGGGTLKELDELYAYEEEQKAVAEGTSKVSPSKPKTEYPGSPPKTEPKTPKTKLKTEQTKIKPKTKIKPPVTKTKTKTKTKPIELLKTAAKHAFIPGYGPVQLAKYLKKKGYIFKKKK